MSVIGLLNAVMVLLGGALFVLLAVSLGVFIGDFVLNVAHNMRKNKVERKLELVKERLTHISILDAYAVVIADLKQDIGYTESGERNRDQALQLLGSRAKELRIAFPDLLDK